MVEKTKDLEPVKHYDWYVMMTANDEVFRMLKPEFLLAKAKALRKLDKRFAGRFLDAEVCPEREMLDEYKMKRTIAFICENQDSANWLMSFLLTQKICAWVHKEEGFAAVRLHKNRVERFKRDCKAG